MPQKLEQAVQYTVLWQLKQLTYTDTSPGPIQRDCHQSLDAAYMRKWDLDKHPNVNVVGIIAEPAPPPKPKLGPYEITKGKTIPNLPLGACSPRPQKIIRLTRSSSANAVFALDSSGRAWRATNWQGARGWTWELIGGNGS